MGSRYGGLKQIEPVGPSGETMLDYSVFDAIRAGFGRVVFVIRRDFEAVFKKQIGAKYAGRIAVDYVYQSLDALPAGFAAPQGRVKPWGTGHATWCARGAVREPFAVINADDFYGADAFRKLAGFLGATQGGDDEAALVGFKLARTLSENGAVSRGVCEVSPDGWLRGVTEHTGILAAEVGKKFSGDETVSMNCWGFTPRFFDALDARFLAFLRTPAAMEAGAGAKAEFYLPAAVSDLIAGGALRVRALAADADWFGVTYPADRPRVVAALAALVARGEYPARLANP